MITRLINFIGNKKVILRVIIVIVVLAIVYYIFFSTTKEEFDTDGDGKIDKVEYYQKGIKIREVIYYDKAIPKGVEYIFWNKDSEVDKIVTILSDRETIYSKYIFKCDKGINVHRFGKDYIKQKFISVKVVDKGGKTYESQLRGDSYIYSKDRKKFFEELFEKQGGRLVNMLFFDSDGRTAQTKEDKDSNGKFDYYEYYEHGKKIAVGYDYDEDGEIDKKEEVKNKSR